MSAKKPDLSHRPIKRCSFPWEWLTISPAGTVMPCCWAGREVGNLQHNSLEEIWNGPKMVRLRGAIANGYVDPICKNAGCAFVQETEAMCGNDAYDLSVEVGEEIRTTDSGNTAHFVDGWSYPEPWGIWSNAQDATLLMDLPRAFRNSYTLELLCRGGNCSEHRYMEISCSANGRLLKNLQFNFPAETTAACRKIIHIPADVIMTRRLEVRFHIERPFCPADFGGADGRQIGIGISSIRMLAIQ